MNGRKTNAVRQGFTLVEVMLAVAILSLIVTAVYSTWSASLMAWRRGGDASAVFQRQRIVMDTLTELAQSVVFFGGSSSLYAVSGIRKPGWGDTVSFVTASDVLLPPSEAIDVGMRRVTISLEQDEYARTYLAIVNSPAVSAGETNITSMLQAHVLSMDVSGFSVRYLDPRDNTWYDKWEDANIPPLAMEFTLMFGRQGDRLPPVVVTRAVDIPVAAFIAQNAGVGLNPTPVDQVQKQPVDAAGTQNNSGGQPSGGQPSPSPSGSPRGGMY